MKKMELLAPAGDLEKLKIAVLYGADAVYFGGETFSLRAGAGNMTLEEMKEHLGGHLANLLAMELGIPYKPGTTTEVECHLAKTIVHG